MTFLILCNAYVMLAIIIGAFDGLVFYQCVCLASVFGYLYLIRKEAKEYKSHDEEMQARIKKLILDMEQSRTSILEATNQINKENKNEVH